MVLRKRILNQGVQHALDFGHDRRSCLSFFIEFLHLLLRQSGVDFGVGLCLYDVGILLLLFKFELGFVALHDLFELQDCDALRPEVALANHLVQTVDGLAVDEEPVYKRI